MKIWGGILFLVGVTASGCATAMIVNDLKIVTEPFVFTWAWSKAHPMRLVPYLAFSASLTCIMSGIFQYNFVDSEE